MGSTGVGVTADAARRIMPAVIRPANGRAAKLRGRVDPPARDPIMEAALERPATMRAFIDAGA